MIEVNNYNLKCLRSPLIMYDSKEVLTKSADVRLDMTRDGDGESVSVKNQ